MQGSKLRIFLIECSYKNVKFSVETSFKKILNIEKYR